MADTKARAIEKHIGDIIALFIYAAQKDIEKVWANDKRYSEVIHQSYDNLIAPKDKQLSGLKARFTISDEMKQYGAFFFHQLVKEIGQVHLPDSDSLDVIKTTVDAEVAECFTVFMLDFGTVVKPHFGPTLAGACDPGDWFLQQIAGGMPIHINSKVLCATICREFLTFFRALAYKFAKMIYYADYTMSGAFMLGTLASNHMRQDLLDVLQATLRVKPVAKPRPKKAGTDASPPASTDATPPAAVQPPTVADLADAIMDV